MKYYVALFQKLKEIYLSLNNIETELVLMCPSNRIFTQEELELLLPNSLINKENISEAINKKLDISFQLNSNPINEEYWDINPANTLFQKYEYILQNIKAKNVFETIDEQLLFKDDKRLFVKPKNEKTLEYSNYGRYFKLYQKSLEELNEFLLSYDENFNETEKEVWLNKLSILRTKNTISYGEFVEKGYKTYIEGILAEYKNNSEISQFVEQLNQEMQMFDLSTKTSENLMPYHNLQFVPYDFMKTESGWNSITMEKDELEEYYLKATKSTSNYLNEISLIDKKNSEIKGISLEFAFVHLQRSWFNKSILLSKHLESKAEKEISNGINISSEMLLPGYTKAMILIKNLRIILEDNAPKEGIDKPNTLIHFGPIVMKQQLFINERNNIKFIKPIINKSTLKSAQFKINESLVYEKSSKPILVSKKTEQIKDERLIEKSLENKKTTENKNLNYINLGLKNIKPKIFSSFVIPDEKIILNTKVNINVKDIKNLDPIYKANVSIRGNNNVFIEVETNKEGMAICNLSKGNYNIEIQINGYQQHNASISINKESTISVSYNLTPEKEINFNSYFLVGMICEKLPKIPKN